MDWLICPRYNNEKVAIIRRVKNKEVRQRMSHIDAPLRSAPFVCLRYSSDTQIGSGESPCRDMHWVVFELIVRHGILKHQTHVDRKGVRSGVHALIEVGFDGLKVHRMLDDAAGVCVCVCD